MLQKAGVAFALECSHKYAAHQSLRKAQNMFAGVTGVFKAVRHESRSTANHACRHDPVFARLVAWHSYAVFLDSCLRTHICGQCASERALNTLLCGFLPVAYATELHDTSCHPAIAYPTKS